MFRLFGRKLFHPSVKVETVSKTAEITGNGIYEMDKNDEVIEAKNIPSPEPGAPLPIVASTDYDTYLAYYATVPHPDWNRTNPIEVHPSMVGGVALVRLERCSVHLFGYPNDEALNGHPLWKHGLRPY